MNVRTNWLAFNPARHSDQSWTLCDKDLTSQRSPPGNRSLSCCTRHTDPL